MSAFPQHVSGVSGAERYRRPVPELRKPLARGLSSVTHRAADPRCWRTACRLTHDFYRLYVMPDGSVIVLNTRRRPSWLPA